MDESFFFFLVLVFRSVKAEPVMDRRIISTIKVDILPMLLAISHFLHRKIMKNRKVLLVLL